MEIQILELKKLPADVKSGDDLINWMRFFGGKTRKEFAAMAKTDEYIDEAFKELKKLSADDRAKYEYEARERAIRDYNSQMSSALMQGRQQGMKQGIEQGIKQGVEQGIKQGIEQVMKDVVEKLSGKGMNQEEIAALLDISVEEVKRLR